MDASSPPSCQVIRQTRHVSRVDLARIGGYRDTARSATTHTWLDIAAYTERPWTCYRTNHANRFSRRMCLPRTETPQVAVPPPARPRALLLKKRAGMLHVSAPRTTAGSPTRGKALCLKLACTSTAAKPAGRASPPAAPSNLPPRTPRRLVRAASRPPRPSWATRASRPARRPGYRPSTNRAQRVVDAIDHATLAAKPSPDERERSDHQRSATAPG